MWLGGGIVSTAEPVSGQSKGFRLLSGGKGRSRPAREAVTVMQVQVAPANLTGVDPTREKRKRHTTANAVVTRKGVLSGPACDPAAK
ncbi:hypothetical protein AGIG_G3056 [Arapaima gigas]